MQDINLEDKVFMENQLIKIRNEIEPKLKTYFKDYIGKKIFTNDGTLIKKIKNDETFKSLINVNNYNVNPLNKDHVLLSLYTTGPYYNLILNIKLCFNGGSYDDKNYYCVYIERSLYIGELDKHVLTVITKPEQIKLLDYKHEKKQIELFKIKSKELKEIRDKINYQLRDFIKYDLVK